ncbi:L-threonine 3-dehydrogenase [Helcobacillus massiliensis]|uniref:L-threonine 3-dehydrogenase n=1 Tax=Helcobacillus massiliensis TaxID=521392 RepID=UPI00255283F9|nr:L-threonine 3-dehydrogenase [Helcobacillus massiliensis]MDK7742287.1 L-threonine 3-dehydrogenase [Helcobacillus massiliensis]WOO93538.1 L-threonine 3-dehydrogenase [Helcobacillus massiliensis]
MKALKKVGASAGLEFVDVPEPQLERSTDVKIRVLRAGICGTDLHILAWDSSAQDMCDTVPFIPGHEFYGEVVEVGSEVLDVKVGDRVSGEGHVVCNICRNCRAGRRHMCRRSRGIGVQRDGAFAEYVVIPDENVWVHEHNSKTDIITPELGAVFDPLGNAVHTTLKFPVVGEDVLITGAGPIGLMCAAVARHAGARYIAITDVADHRLDMAAAAGADVAINVAKERVRDSQAVLGMIEGFDVGLETSGNPSAVKEMIDNMNHGGKISLLGLPAREFEINWTHVITRMLTLQGIYGREMFETWNAMSAMLRSSEKLRGQILATVTDVLPAEQWEKGYEMARTAAGGKIVLDWENV